MQLLLPVFIAQIDFFGGVAGVVLAVALSFVVITLISSYYRFQKIVEMAERVNPEEMGAPPAEILRVQLARYLAGCARRGTSFSISLIDMGNQNVHVRMDAPIINAIKHAARHDDVVCVQDEQTAVLLTETEPEDSTTILSRITEQIAEHCPDISYHDLRVGIASYPNHGLRGKDLIRVAQEGLEKASEEAPIMMQEIVDLDEEDESPSEEVVEEKASEHAVPEMLEMPEDDGTVPKGWKDRRKNAILDDLTGVLKPSAVSAYMQRALSEIRRKKQQAALFCIGVNNMDHIARFHGSDAADDVLAGVSGILQKNFRVDDLIGRHEKYAFLVLAQCSPEEAEWIGKRVTTLVQHGEFISENKKLKTTITLGVASYPEHGRNLHHLYTAGQKVLDYSRENDIRAYAVFDPKIHDKVKAKPMKNIKSVQA